MTTTMRWLPALTLLCLGCSAELEVKGNTERVVGETVSVKLLEGDPTLSGVVTLEDARGRTYDNEALGVLRPNERALSFVIPAGISQGSATAELGKSDEDGVYVLPLSVSRIAAAMHADGSVELLPLRPSPLQTQTIPPPQEAGTSRELVISPLGGLMVTLIGDDFAFHILGKEVTSLASINAAEGRLAALPDGALLATPDHLRVYRYVPSIGTDQAPGLSFPAGETLRAVAASADGNWALVLTSCSSAAPGDCLVQIDLRGTSPTIAASVRLDDTVSATQLSARADGSGALVADGSELYGVTFGGGTGQAVAAMVPSWWAGAAPSSVARTMALIEGQQSDLFAVAAKGVDAVRMLGFKEGQLRDISSVELSFVPDHISFGQGTDLYILSGQTLYSANAAAPGQPEQLLTAPSAAPQRFAVQP